jgi:hypothetical protein
MSDKKTGGVCQFLYAFLVFPNNGYKNYGDKRSQNNKRRLWEEDKCEIYLFGLHISTVCTFKNECKLLSLRMANVLFFNWPYF